MQMNSRRVPAAAEICDLIIRDLQFGADNLSLKGATPVGRITKGAAQGMRWPKYIFIRRIIRK